MSQYAPEREQNIVFGKSTREKRNTDKFPIRIRFLIFLAGGIAPWLIAYILINVL
ncbi:hypothetical protein [Azospirillum sp. sgz302134]